MKLEDSLQYFKGVGPKRAEHLAASGFQTLEDLLYHLPFRYEDRRVVSRVAELEAGRDVTLVGAIGSIKLNSWGGRSRRQVLRATFVDETGRLPLVWFHQGDWIRKKLEGASSWLVHGRVEVSKKRVLQIVHPELEALSSDDDAAEAARVVPVYQKPGEIPVATMRSMVERAVVECSDLAKSVLPAPVEADLSLLPLADALRQVHMPGSSIDPVQLAAFATEGHRRLILEELFALQVGVNLRRVAREAESGQALPRADRLVSGFLDALPFNATSAQLRVIDEIAEDMARPRPMNRLVQGDVGSGKTVVAFAAALQAIDAGTQVAVMAPTELLAEQHFRTMETWAVEQGVRIELLTGGLSTGRAAAARERLQAGEVDLVVGTHSLLQSGTGFAALGLAVIDEQHRFGVLQRAVLKEAAADTLLLSATPIPRTMALTLYGDVDLSLLDEMPPGRKTIVTRVLRHHDVEHLFGRMAAQMKEGRQCYIVYPLVEESENVDLEDASGTAEKLRAGVFRDFEVGLLHGRMKADEKNEVMRGFQRGDINVLVATTVIEVGIDVPNAGIMVVMHADRFGLAQLHQLRGRVGRDNEQAYCCLVSDERLGRDAWERLKVMENSSDGFEIAEADLRIRGPGEYLGTRQAGVPAFRAANLARDEELLLLARDKARQWLEQDPGLSDPRSSELRKSLANRWGDSLALAEVG